VQGGFFLRKKPLIIVLSVYSNWRTAIKPGISLMGLIGTTKVRPCYKANRIRPDLSFSAACEAVLCFKESW
jgi:hypothetical protein